MLFLIDSLRESAIFKIIGVIPKFDAELKIVLSLLNRFFIFREMSGKEYLGYPEYVVITLPKCGTKTMNKCFTSLGYKGNKIICSLSIEPLVPVPELLIISPFNL